MSKRTPTPSEKWIISKIDEHDKQIKDILQLLKEIRIEVEATKDTFVIEVLNSLDSLIENEGDEPSEDGNEEALEGPEE